MAVDVWATSNEHGDGLVISWASIIDENTRKQAEAMSRCSVLEGHLALMPDAHFGYGPPVGAAMKTRNAIIPYAVGVDIGCGMIAAKTDLERGDLRGVEGKILGAIRESIPSGVGVNHSNPTDDAERFVKRNGLPPGLSDSHVMKAAMQKRHVYEGEVSAWLEAKAKLQFGTLGAGNHFVEVSLSDDGAVWLVLHSGSRGIGNVLATAHAKLAKASCERARIILEDKDFAYFAAGSPSFDAYVADMLWAQEYAMASRESMMIKIIAALRYQLGGRSLSLEVINCHHNYAEEVEEGVWLTRKGAINAEVGKYGVIPGSMGAATHIVRGLGCKEALNT
ncbi:hypothetical protein LCGC14_2394470, partial [marine sediment metagenome]